MTQPIENALPETPARLSSRFSARSLITFLGPFIGLIAVFTYFSILEPKTFPTADNMILLLKTSSVVALAAIGMTLIIISGGIDLSAGSQIALAGVIAAWMLRAGYSTTATIAVAVGAIAFSGMVIGATITYMRLLPFIVTLGAMTILRGAALYIAPDGTINSNLDSGNWPDHSQWLVNLLQVNWDSTSRIGQIPYGVWMIIGIAIATSAMLQFTRFGRHVYAIGSNEQTAILCGIRTNLVKTAVYTIGGALTGLAGVLFFGFNNQGDATGANGWELQVIAGVVIGGASLNGGRGSILGSLIGILIIGMINSGCTIHGYSTAVQQIATGLIIIAAVALDKLRQKAA